MDQRVLEITAAYLEINELVKDRRMHLYCTVAVITGKLHALRSQSNTPTKLEGSGC